MPNTREQDGQRNQRVSPLVSGPSAVISTTPDTWHHGHGGGFSSSSGVKFSLVTTLARRNVSAIFAAVVDKRWVAGLTDNPGPMTPALRTGGRCWWSLHKRLR
jgi:hypothetical protein